MRQCMIAGIFLMTMAHTIAQPVKLTLDDLKVDTTDVHLVYRLMLDGDSVGYAAVEIMFSDGHFTLREVTEVEGFNETIVVHGSSRTLLPYSVVVAGETGGHGIDCQTQIGRRITGYARYPDHPDHPVREMNMDLVPDMMERTCSFFLFLPWMPLEETPECVFTQLNTLSCTMHDIVVDNTKKKQRIRTPAGTYNTTRVEFRGGEASQNFYLSTTEPKVIARITLEELPWRYELVAAERGPL